MPPLFYSTKYNMFRFYKEDCQFCTAEQNHFYRVAEYFSDRPNIHFHAINCDTSTFFCWRRGIYGVPRLLLRNNQNKEEFTYFGNRNDFDITQWIQNITNIPTSDRHFVIPQLNFSQAKDVIDLGTCSVLILHNGMYSINARHVIDEVYENNKYFLGSINVDQDPNINYFINFTGIKLPIIYIASTVDSGYTEDTLVPDKVFTKIKQVCQGKTYSEMMNFVYELSQDQKPKLIPAPFAQMTNFTQITKLISQFKDNRISAIQEQISFMEKTYFNSVISDFVKNNLRHRILALMMVIELKKKGKMK